MMARPRDVEEAPSSPGDMSQTGLGRKRPKVRPSTVDDSAKKGTVDGGKSQTGRGLHQLMVRSSPSELVNRVAKYLSWAASMYLAATAN